MERRIITISCFLGGRFSAVFFWPPRMSRYNRRCRSPSFSANSCPVVPDIVMPPLVVLVLLLPVVLGFDVLPHPRASPPPSSDFRSIAWSFLSRWLGHGIHCFYLPPFLPISCDALLRLAIGLPLRLSPIGLLYSSRHLGRVPPLFSRILTPRLLSFASKSLSPHPSLC